MACRTRLELPVQLLDRSRRREFRVAGRDGGRLRLSRAALVELRQDQAVVEGDLFVRGPEFRLQSVGPLLHRLGLAEGLRQAGPNSAASGSATRRASAWVDLKLAHQRGESILVNPSLLLVLQPLATEVVLKGRDLTAERLARLAAVLAS